MPSHWLHGLFTVRTNRKNRHCAQVQSVLRTSLQLTVGRNFSMHKGGADDHSGTRRSPVAPAAPKAIMAAVLKLSPSSTALLGCRVGRVKVIPSVPRNTSTLKRSMCRSVRTSDHCIRIRSSVWLWYLTDSKKV